MVYHAGCDFIMLGDMTYRIADLYETSSRSLKKDYDKHRNVRERQWKKRFRCGKKEQ